MIIQSAFSFTQNKGRDRNEQKYNKKNHFSDKPMIPRPPELKSNAPVVSKDWRLAL